MNPMTTGEKVALTGLVATFFYFAYTSSKMAEAEASEGYAKARADYARSRHRRAA